MRRFIFFPEKEFKIVKVKRFDARIFLERERG
jgi:hypothetical protein